MISYYFILKALLVSLTIASKDEQAPVFTDCPKCITKEATENEIHVHWSAPKATDDSGVKPAIRCNRHSGDLFSVPSATLVECTAEDPAGNRATCSFKITLKRKRCSLFDPPQNGALVCNSIGGDDACAVMCQNGFDFTFNPPYLYYCSGGKWNFFGIPGIPYSTQPPGPNCSSTVQPSSIKISGVPGFFFNGDINDPNVLQTVKENFISLATKPYIPPSFCKDKPDQCSVDALKVYHV